MWTEENLKEYLRSKRRRGMKSRKHDVVRELRKERQRRKWPYGTSWSVHFLNSVHAKRVEKKKDHLRSRGMNPDLYELAFADDGSVTFNLYNGTGKWVGYQTYKQNKTSKKNNDPRESRYYTYLPAGVDGVFGLECLDPTKRELYVVEGVFKAAKLHALGFNAIAVLSCHPKRLKSWFRILKARYHLVAIGDNDDAGKKLVNFVKSGFQSPNDLDEMSNEEVLELLQRR